jgi:hypothetical protein
MVIVASDTDLPHAFPPIVRTTGIVMLVVGGSFLIMMSLTVSFLGYSDDADLLNRTYFFFVAVTVSGGIIVVMHNITLANNLAQRK